MPKSKNKNTNKNKNNIRITIHNNSSSKRKRKGGSSKGGAPSTQSNHGNSMPTIIQMHQPQPTISQIADNRYGVGMSEKIDALSGGVTRVLENLENNQLENYTRKHNEEFLRKMLNNRENELSALSRSKPPSVVEPLKVPTPTPSLSDQIPSPRSISSSEPSLKIPYSFPLSETSSMVSSKSALSSVSKSFNGSLNDEYSQSSKSDFIDSVREPAIVDIIRSPQHNVDDDNVSDVSLPFPHKLDGNLKNSENPMKSNPKKFIDFVSKKVRSHKHLEANRIHKEHVEKNNDENRAKKISKKHYDASRYQATKNNALQNAIDKEIRSSSKKGKKSKKDLVI